MAGRTRNLVKRGWNIIATHLLLLAVFFTGLACPTVFAAETRGSTIPLADCRLENKNSGSVSARCGWYSVAEDRSKGKTIRIHVAMIPALRRQPLADPLFIVSGGPGQAASDFYLSSQGAFERLRRNRDLIVVDQRGTGRSQRLDCEFPDDLETTRFDAKLLQRYTRECLTKLDGDPRFYTTSVAVQDLDAIRAALGYKKINLYGISYGTRVVQHYARRFAAHVRSLILDGIVPAEAALGPEIAPTAQKTLEDIFSRCAQDKACRDAFGNIDEQFAQLRTRLASKPVSLVLADPKTAAVTQLDWGLPHLAVATRLLSYSDATASLLPLLISQASQNHPEALAAQALMVARNLREQIANGMHNAVVCTEDVPFFDKASLQDAAIDRSYLGRVFVDALQAMCAVWPVGVIDPDFHAALHSDLPALLLSGENDPVTPAAYGDRAAKSFSKGKHVVMPGQGHGQLNLPCGTRLMAQFIETGSSENLNTNCVSQQHAAPFMLTATGPGP